MTQVEKIKAEIESLQAKTSIGLNEYTMGYENGKAEVCRLLLSFINSLQAEPVSEDLELASERYACKYSDSKYGYKKVSEAFQAGANWQKEQMMKALLDMEKDSVEVEHKYGEGGRELYLKMLGVVRMFEED